MQVSRRESVREGERKTGRWVERQRGGREGAGGKKEIESESESKRERGGGGGARERLGVCRRVPDQGSGGGNLDTLVPEGAPGPRRCFLGHQGTDFRRNQQPLVVHTRD